VKIVFMGSPDFATATLDALVEARHDIRLVVTQPDRPAGRGRHLVPTPVKVMAESFGLPVITQDRGAEERDRVTAAVLAEAPEVIVVTAFGHILRRPLLEAPPFGCLNLHFSLLPRWRGVSPVQHAVLHGDTWTGVTIMQMDAGVDTGPILAHEAVPIAPQETAGDLLAQLAGLGADLLVRTLRRLANGPSLGGSIVVTPQNDTGAVYAPKLSKSLSPLRWDRDVVTVHNQVRALDPVPGTTSFLGEKLLKIGAARPYAFHTADAEPGTILGVADAGILVACGAGVLELTRMQAPGRKMLPVEEFLRGFPVQPGQVFRS
jgi:methionyl-tRNA formyltransferase